MKTKTNVNPNLETTLQEVLAALQGNRSAAVSSETSPEKTGDPSCALCRLSQRSVRRTLRDLFSEFVNDPPLRVRIRAARGFCRYHLPLIVDSGDGLGIAILTHDLADETLQNWGERDFRLDKNSGSNASDFRSRLASFFASGSSPSAKTECLLCETEKEADTRYASALAAGLSRPEVWESCLSNREFCVRHVEMLVSLARPPERARLIQLETEHLTRLKNELEEFIRKNDYRFREEPMGEEGDSWRRALLKLNS